jgi:hypothetical protein
MVNGGGDVMLDTRCWILDAGCWMIEAKPAAVGGLRLEARKLKAQRDL